MSAISLLLVDDQILFREGLRTVLSVHPDLRVVAEASNGAEAVSLARQWRPDVVLMDLRMPQVDGVEATRQIRQLVPESQVIVLTTFDDDDEVFEALRAGAIGYLLKDIDSATLVSAIRSAARGESFLVPSIAAKVVTELVRLSANRPIEDAAVESLSERERSVLTLLAEGLSNKEIAYRLNLAEGTVKNHMTNILAKLGVADRTQAALKARDLGLI